MSQRGRFRTSLHTSAAPAELRAVNARFWEIEDELRDCERRGEFGGRFVEFTRGVYRENDRRSAPKREINFPLGSPLIEKKSYRPY
jgi:hypothetical protein